MPELPEPITRILELSTLAKLGIGLAAPLVTGVLAAWTCWIICAYRHTKQRTPGEQFTCRFCDHTYIPPQDIPTCPVCFDGSR